MGGKLGLNKLGQFKLAGTPSALGAGGLVPIRNFDIPEPRQAEFDPPMPIGEMTS